LTATPRAAVVLCTRDRPQLLDDALHAIRAAVRPDDEVLVVDSGARTRDAIGIAARHGVQLIVESRPGLSRARNAGVSATTAEIIAFTDDDCRPGAQWTASLAAAFADPNVGVALGRLRPEHPNAAVPADDPGDDAFAFDGNADVSALGAGANMAFRRAALRASRGFDESLGAGSPLRSGEDHDMVWRVLRSGWIGRYEPAATVVHLDWLSPWQAVRKRYNYGVGAGAVAAKVARVDPARGRTMMARKLWTDGARRALADGVKGYQRAALGDVLYVIGVIAGAGVVARRSLTEGVVAPDQLS
jgi:glycosyltransferase involved in cell wall biosynthesis